ncbi:MAG: hypothetical protein WC027_01310 [Candidatus Paceibacterota bacterium]
MKTKNKPSPTLSVLNLKQLKKQLTNPAGVPMWQLHPSVQHCLRLFQDLRPGTVERKCADDSDWVVNHGRSSAMFLVPYRLKNGAFNLRFLEDNSAYGWFKDIRVKP